MVYKIKRYIRLVCAVISHPILVLYRLKYNIKRIIADILYPFGYSNYSHHIIFLAGMALGGSTWMKQLLSGIPGVFTRPTPMPKDIATMQNICDSAFSRVSKHGNTLFKTHLNPTKENVDCLLRNGVEKILVTYRDLRDVAVSHYYRLLSFPKPKDAFDYKDYKLMSREDGLNDLIEHTAEFYISWIFGWFKIAEQMPDKIHFTRFEDLKNNTAGEFKKVLDFYGIKLLDKTIDKIVENARGRGNMKSNLLKAKILPSGITSNFRSGKAGQWKTELSNAQKKKCRELLGSALIELEYEKDLNW